ncbi:MAG TPA: superoxide dismutase [Flavisolibacter sp.]
MTPMQTRRNFLLDTTKAGLGLWVGSTILSACSSQKKAASVSGSRFSTSFTQQPLPYGYNALGDAIDGTTMEIHYTRHAGAYASNLQDAARAEGVDMNKPLEDALSRVSRYSAKFRNNGGGHYNHEMFWKCMSPSGAEVPSGQIATALTDAFGSFETFRTQFTDAAMSRFGSGWAWLIVDGDRKLRITSTPNQDNPLMDVAEMKGFPVLGLDVWEHAYYLRYQNKRADYVKNWWKVVNWNYVQDRYLSVI